MYIRFSMRLPPIVALTLLWCVADCLPCCEHIAAPPTLYLLDPELLVLVVIVVVAVVVVVNCQLSSVLSWGHLKCFPLGNIIVI